MSIIIKTYYLLVKTTDSGARLFGSTTVNYVAYKNEDNT